jgi:AraC-like DNA-binding protein
VIHALLLTTIEPLSGWPGCEKIVHESRKPGSYRELVRLQLRESATVQFLIRGRLRWRTGESGEWRMVEPGQALVYDAGIHGDLAYEGDPDGGHLEFIYANLLGSAMCSAVRGITTKAGHAVPTHGAEDLIARWATRLNGGAEASHRCLSAVETCELAWSFLHPLARGLAPNNRLAERAMAMLTEQWQDPPQLAELAKRLAVSREHLSRILRATCGQPPATWLRRYRVSRAAEMLEAGQTIQQAAKACGFCSPPHFIHAFRRVHGTTPGRWLRDRQG